METRQLVVMLGGIGLSPGQQRFFLRAQAAQKRRQVLGPRVPVKRAGLDLRRHETLHFVAAMLAIGPCCGQGTVVTGPLLWHEPRATGRTVGPHAQELTGRAELPAVIKKDLALEPDPLRVRQQVITRHDPETLREQFQQTPLPPLLLALAQVLTQGLAAVLEICGTRTCPLPS